MIIVSKPMLVLSFPVYLITMLVARSDADYTPRRKGKLCFGATQQFFVSVILSFM